MSERDEPSEQPCREGSTITPPHPSGAGQIHITADHLADSQAFITLETMIGEQDITAETSDDSEADVVVEAEVETSPCVFPPTSFREGSLGTFPDRWYYAAEICSDNIVAVTGIATTRWWAYPLISTHARTIDQWGIQVTNAVVAGQLRMAIYSNTSTTNLYPAALLLDLGTFDGSTTGQKKVSSTFNLAADSLYWVAYQSNNASIDVVGFTANTALIHVLGCTNIYASRSGWELNRAYGAWTDPFPAGASPGPASSSVPLLAFHYSQ